jgi:hypothetical protein
MQEEPRNENIFFLAFAGFRTGVIGCGAGVGACVCKTRQKSDVMSGLFTLAELFCMLRAKPRRNCAGCDQERS